MRAANHPSFHLTGKAVTSLFADFHTSGRCTETDAVSFRVGYQRRPARPKRPSKQARRSSVFLLSLYPN